MLKVRLSRYINKMNQSRREMREKDRERERQTEIERGQDNEGE